MQVAAIKESEPERPPPEDETDAMASALKKMLASRAGKVNTQDSGACVMVASGAASVLTVGVGWTGRAPRRRARG
jgi:hypothetical protein